jgi:Uncharacterized conserved protein
MVIAKCINYGKPAAFPELNGGLCIMEISLIREQGIDAGELEKSIEQSVADKKLKKVLLVPPDMTRMHSFAGIITGLYYKILHTACQVDIMPALGTHDPMTNRELTDFFGNIPKESFIIHDWRKDIAHIGRVPGEFLNEISEGRMCEPVDVEINRRLLDPSYDLIISIGQVVPHEVVGMANYTKNIVIGCGGCSMINHSHMLGAVYGMERIMGRDHSPVRKVFDYAEEKFLQKIPLLYVLTVTSGENKPSLQGLFIGRNRKLFEDAVYLSQEKNMIFVDDPIQKAVVYLDEKEFKSTWLGNKAIYRTRMAMADGGELIILAPGVRKFGEDAANDRLIRKYGYVGRDRILAQCITNDDLKSNLSVAAHLIHGSSEGRFSITYAVYQMSRNEVEGVHFKYADCKELIKKYDPAKLINGFNKLAGEEIFFIGNPATGLWAEKNRFK